VAFGSPTSSLGFILLVLMISAALFDPDATAVEREQFSRIGVYGGLGMIVVGLFLKWIARTIDAFR